MLGVTKLKIYGKSLDLVTKIYELIRSNVNLYKDYALSDQMKRAAVSIPDNIAEGYCRSRKQFKNSLNIASGSTNEIITLLEIVYRVYNIETHSLKEEYLYLGKQINSFSVSFT